MKGAEKGEWGPALYLTQRTKRCRSSEEENPTMDRKLWKFRITPATESQWGSHLRSEVSESEQKVFGNQESGLASKISILSTCQKKRGNCRNLLGYDFGCKSRGRLETQEQFASKPQVPLHISAVGSRNAQKTAREPAWACPPGCSVGGARESGR